jgi:CelD/BcsL family acetyltransferase involved in cellulose biosynthesis
MQRRGPLLLPGPRRQAVLAALCAGLLREPWQRLRAPTLLPEHGRAIGEALRRGGAICGLRQSLRSPYVPLPSDWDGYLATRSRAMREVLLSRARRLERKHGATLRVLTAPDEVLAAWPEVQEVARHSWSHRQGTSLLVPTGPERMFRPLLHAAAQAGLLWLGVLHLDGRPAAVEIDLVFSGVLYVQKPFYDERAASLSPGQYLMGRMVRRAIEQGLREYDLGGDDEPYKLRFADKVREHVVLWAYRRRPAALAEYLLRHHLRG